MARSFSRIIPVLLALFAFAVPDAVFAQRDLPPQKGGMTYELGTTLSLPFNPSATVSHS